jgi:hypothetical protein
MTLRRLLVASPLVLTACAALGFTAVYPPRPPETPGEAIADPAPSRVVMHATVTGAALKKSIDDALPQMGDGTFPFVRGERKFTWTREPVGVKFDRGRVGVDMKVLAKADLPLVTVDLPMDVHILAEPVVTSEYVAKLQSAEVSVTSDSRSVKLADAAADILDKVKKEIEAKLAAFSYDLKPMIGEAHARIAKPIDLPLGDAHGCASVKVIGVEAGPTVLADGIEKDLALVVAPSVTIPCAEEEEEAPPIPPLANVATIQPGPFTVTLPIAARYDELAKAMGLAFTDGKLFFSKDFPALYLEKPEVYASKDQLVLKLHIAGPVAKAGIETTLDGDLYMSGHPEVVDNELRVPDLEPTIETSNLLLKLKQAFDGDTIRDQARAALHLDIGERVRSVKDKLSKDLAFGNGQGCLKADVNKVELSGVHVHGAYLRVYVNVTGTASLYMPCPQTSPP